MGDIKLAADARKILMTKHTEQIEKRNVILRLSVLVHCTSLFFRSAYVYTDEKWIVFFSATLCFQSLQLTFVDWKEFFSKRNDLKFLSVCRKIFDTFIQNRSFVFVSFLTLKWHCSLLYLIDISSQGFWNWGLLSFRRGIDVFSHLLFHETIISLWVIIFWAQLTWK